MSTVDGPEDGPALNATSSHSTTGMRPVRVAMVMPTDFEQWPTGGGLPILKVLLRAAQRYPIDISLFGISTSKRELPGNIYQRTIHGRIYPFVPIFTATQDALGNTKPRIPLRVQTFSACLRRSDLVDANRFDLMYLHAPEVFPLSLRWTKPMMYHVHGIEEAGAKYSRYSAFRSRLFLYAYRLYTDFVIRRAERVIYVDRESYDLYTSRFPLRAPRFQLAWAPTDMRIFAPTGNRSSSRAALGLPGRGKLIMYVGRLSAKKGVDLIISAFSRLAERARDLYLVIAGDGEERPYLEAQVNSLGVVDSVRFLGKVQHESLPKLYNCADLCVVASKHESHCLVIIESLACGTPVVSTQVGIAPSVIRDGETGFLVTERTTESLMHAIQRGLELDASCSQRCVAAAEAYSHGAESVCEAIISVGSIRATA